MFAIEWHRAASPAIDFCSIKACCIDWGSLPHARRSLPRSNNLQISATNYFKRITCQILPLFREFSAAGQAGVPPRISQEKLDDLSFKSGLILLDSDIGYMRRVFQWGPYGGLGAEKMVCLGDRCPSLSPLYTVLSHSKPSASELSHGFHSIVIRKLT